MARTADDITAEIEELRRAYATGARSVTYEGRTVHYDSGSGLLDRVQELEDEIARLSNTAVGRRSAAARMGFRRAT